PQRAAPRPPHHAVSRAGEAKLFTLKISGGRLQDQRRIHDGRSPSFLGVERVPALMISTIARVMPTGRIPLEKSPPFCSLCACKTRANRVTGSIRPSHNGITTSAIRGGRRPALRVRLCHDKRLPDRTSAAA